MSARLFGAWLRKWRLLGALAAAGAMATALPSTILADTGAVKVRFGGDQTTTRVVIDLDRSVQGKLVSGGDGARELVLDFPKLATTALDGQGRGLVGAWTIERTVTGARLTLSLAKGAVVEKRFLLAPGDGATSYRYVIDLKAATRPAPSAPTAPAQTVIAAAKPAPVAIQKVSTAGVLPSKNAARRKTIVIDAGHGGHDPGARGASAQEKDVTLATAKALKVRLEKTGRYRVVLTRETDTFVPLPNRVQIARRADADLFISLHADAGHNTQTRGASIYTISDKGSTRAARGQGGEGFLNIALPGATKAVQDILFDLTQRATRNKSGDFADLLITEVGRNAPLLTRAHRDAGYVVLLAPDVPSVLFEMGFITNPQDEALLTSATQREKVAAGIANAIDGYFGQGASLAAL